VTVLAVIVALVLAAEYCFAPVNLWTGRTMAVYRRWTGLPPAFARLVLAPVKALTAVALLLGLVWRPLSVIGAAASLGISAFYLVRLAGPTRRDGTGVAAFGAFGALSLLLLVVQLSR
jgi:hypothetical protein